MVHLLPGEMRHLQTVEAAVLVRPQPYQAHLLPMLEEVVGVRHQTKLPVLVVQAVAQADQIQVLYPHRLRLQTQVAVVEVVVFLNHLARMVLEVQAALAS